MIIKAFGAGLAALMSGFLCNVHGKQLWTIFWIAAVANSTGYFCTGTVMPSFVSGLTFALLSEIAAIHEKCPTAVYLPCVIIPFVPGRLMYYMTVEFVQGNTITALHYMVEIALIGGSLGLAVVIAHSLVGTVKKFRRKVKVYESEKERS